MNWHLITGNFFTVSLWENKKSSKTELLFNLAVIIHEFIIKITVNIRLQENEFCNESTEIITTLIKLVRSIT